jgi:hypothetical protein
MVDNKFIYYLALLSTVLLSLYRGGRDEKLASIVALFASLLTSATTLNDDWRDIHLALVLIDVTVLLFFWTISLQTNSYWPYWVTGWQIVGVFAHIQRGLFSDIMPGPYSMISRLLAYPMLALIALSSLSKKDFEKE